MAAALLGNAAAPFLYTVNDDLFMKSIVSGAYLGRPDAHTVYLEYPLSLFLSGLYRLTDRVPWYGIVFFSFHVISWGAVISRCLGAVGKRNFESGKKSPERIVAAFFLVSFFGAAGFYHMASMQFTTTAAVLGAAALVWFLTADVSQKTGPFLRDQAVTALFVFLSFNVRRNVLLMFVPMAGMLWLGRWLFETKALHLTAERKQQGIKFAGMAALCLSGVAVTVVSYRLAYGSPAWQNYIRFNDHATVLYDYSGWPDYEQNRELYEELGITREGWYGAKTAYFLSVDNGIDARAMELLAERSEALRQEERTLPQALFEALQVCAGRMLQETDRPLNLLVLGLYAAVLAGLLLGREKRALLELLLFAAGRMFAWLYVALAGRYPVRITQSLLLAESAVLLVFLCRDAGRGYLLFWQEKKDGITASDAANTIKTIKKAGKLITLAGTAVLFWANGYFSVARIRHAASENTARLAESRDLEELKAYCSAHPERFYFVDTRSVTNDTERIFDASQSSYENYIVFGGWLSESPVYLDKLKAEGASDVEAALLKSGRAFVIVENEERCPVDYIVSYFESRYEGFRMEETERFGREGGQFSVYRLLSDGPSFVNSLQTGGQGGEVQ